MRWMLAGAAVFLAGALALAFWQAGRPLIDADDAALVAAGRPLYERHCAACHGANLEGQPNWRRRQPNGRLPAPPHDAEGHTWHHPDALLIGIVSAGLVPGRYAPPGYESDMPAFGRVLSEREIVAVLAYIKSRWPEAQRDRQRQIDRESRR